MQQPPAFPVGFPSGETYSAFAAVLWRPRRVFFYILTVRAISFFLRTHILRVVSFVRRTGTTECRVPRLIKSDRARRRRRLFFRPIFQNETFSLRPPARIKQPPLPDDGRSVHAFREQSRGTIEMVASHDGFRILYKRTIFVCSTYADRRESQRIGRIAHDSPLWLSREYSEERISFGGRRVAEEVDFNSRRNTVVRN